MNFFGKISKTHWIIIALVMVAIVIRIAYYFTYYPPLTFDSGDSHVYDIPAWNIIQGNGYVYDIGEPFAAREPGYALFFLVPIYALFGHSPTSVVIVQYILDIVMLLAVMYLLQRFTRQSAIALIGGLLYMAYLPFVFQQGEILTETPYQFYLLITIGLFIFALQRRQKRLFLICGLVLGITTLIRWGSILLPVFLIAVIVLHIPNWKQRFQFCSLLIGGMIIVISPWIIRNYYLFDTFIFGRIGGGEIYWTGSYIPYDGEWYPNAPELASVRAASVSELEYDKAVTQLAIENIKANPIGVAWIWLKKPFKIYSFPEALNYLNRTGMPTLQLKHPGMILALGLTIALHWLLLIGGLYGFLKKNYLSSVVRFTFISVILFSIALYLPLNPVPRYNIPLMPYFIMLTAPVLYYFMKRIRKSSSGNI